MACDTYKPFIGAYVDGEFDSRDAAEFEAHVASCEACRRELEEQMRMKELVERSADDESAPDALRESIEAELEDIDREEEGTERSSTRRRTWAALAAMVPVALGIGLVLWMLPSMTVAPVSSGQEPVVEQTVEWHKQSFPNEVEGPDQQKVSNWFRGKVDFPVRVPDFSRPDVRLEGGRIANVRERRAAYLSYDVGGKRLSVMIFHADDWNVPTHDIRSVGGRDVAVLNDSGYEVAILQDDGITYTLTSDLREAELVDLVAASVEGRSD